MRSQLRSLGLSLAFLGSLGSPLASADRRRDPDRLTIATFNARFLFDGVEPEHFVRWLSLWRRHTSALFAPADAAELQRIAHGIARNLFQGFFAGRHTFPFDDSR